MNLYIKVENNLPVNYPMVLENILMIYSDFNIETKSHGFIKYKQNPAPYVDEPYLVIEQVLEIIDNECVEKYRVRSMTAQEKTDKINSMDASKPYASWILDTETCRWKPPIAMPDGKYRWNETTTSWDPESI